MVNLFDVNNSADVKNDIISPCSKPGSKAVVSKRFVITDDFEISNHDKSYFLFKSSLYEEYIPKKSLKSLGVYIQFSSTLEFMDVDSNKKWAIYNLNGILLKSGNVGTPDFSQLQSGDFYIVVEGDQKYKYLHIR